MTLERNLQYKQVSLLLLVLICALVTASLTYAAPPIKPSSFFGTVILDAVTVPEGTLLTGWIDNRQVSQTSTLIINGESRFRIGIPGDDPNTPEIEGGVEGQIITFKIDGYQADQTAVWRSGTYQRLDLTATIPPAPPTADFIAGKPKNVALLEDGAQVIDYSSAFNTTSTYTPDNAIDYDSSATGFSSWRTASTGAQNEWLKVELAGQQAHIIDRVVLRSPGDYLQNFEVRVSTTGTSDSDFSTVYTGVYAPNTSRQTFTFPPVAARYVQLYIIDGDGSSNYIRLAEFQVWTRERAGGIVSLSAGPPSTVVDVSSFVAGFEPEKAIDDDASVSRWKTASGDVTDQWFTVALGGGNRSYEINRVRLQGAGFTTMPQNFAVRVSNTTTDTTAFTPVFEGTMALNGNMQEFAFPAVEAKYVQLFVYDNFGSGCCVELKDFEVLSVYGTNTSRLGGVGASIVDSLPNGAQRTLDNNLITSWSASTGGWFKLRLLEGGPYSINHLKLNATSAQSAQFTLAVSNQTSADIDFTTVYTGTFRTDGRDHWISFPDASARYVRFEITNINGSSISFRDFQVFASNLGGAVVPLDNFSVDSDGGIVSQLWNFGDGQTSIETHPVHTFAAPGEYPIRLTITDTDGLTATHTLPYRVLTSPQADFYWTPDPAFEGQSIRFTDSSLQLDGQIVGQVWESPALSFPEFNQRSIFITFPDSGEQLMTLTVSDSQFLTGTISKTIIINNLPPVVDAGQDLTIPWGKTWPTWQLAPAVSDPSPADQQALTCVWTFGDGNSQQIDSCTNLNVKVSHSYAVPGVYTTTLAVTDPDGDTGSDNFVVTVLKHNTYIDIGTITILPTGEAEVAVTLYDQLTGDPIANETVSAAANGSNDSQVTDAQGQAVLLLPVNPGNDIPLQINYGGNTLYNSAAATDVINSGPDLTINALDISQATTDLQLLSMDGSVDVQIFNQGNLTTDQPFDVIVFEDRDQDGAFSATDNLLGQSNYGALLSTGQSVTMTVPVAGPVLFRDSPLYAFVDSSNVVSEANEQNNVIHTCQFCEFAPPEATSTAFQPELEWSWIDETGFFNGVQLYGSMMTPVVAPLLDTNGDSVVDEEDVPAIIFIPFGNRLVAVRGDTGETIFDQSAYPVGQGEQFSQIAVGDIDNDNLPEIITIPQAPASNGTRLIAFENDGSFKWYSEVIPFPRMQYGGVSLADLDHDGSVEIVAAATVLNGDGQIMWSGGYGTGNGGVCCLSAAADIDLDGSMEIVTGRTVYRANGEVFWHAVNSADGWPAIGNFDDDPFAEIVSVNFGFIVLRDHDGTAKWSKVIDGSSGSRCGPPTVANYDLDPEPEIGVACGANYHVFEGDGTEKWAAPVEDGSSGITGSSVFDFNGDGIAEVVYNDEFYLRIFRGTDGAVLFEEPNSSGTLLESPVIADVDVDGNAEIVVARNNWGTFADQLGLTEFGVFVYGDAFDNWVKTRSIWNQHTYHITNINDDATIPTWEEPSWLTHNSYRANLSLDVSPLAAPDLTTSRLVVTPLAAGGADLTVRVGNGGLNLVADGVPVAFYNGDPGAGGSLIGVGYTQQTLRSGDYEDVTLTWSEAPVGSFDVFVRVDDDGQGVGTENECDEENNAHSLTYTPPIDLAIVKDSTTVTPLQPGALVSFTLTVENRSPITVENATMVDVLPANIAVVTVSGSGIITPGEVSWSLPALGSGVRVSETLVLQLAETLTETIAAITNTGRVDLDPAFGSDIDLTNNKSVVTLSVQVNRLPVAGDDTFTIDEDVDTVLDVLANDKDPDGDLLAVTMATQPANGTAAVQANGSILYSPDAEFSGEDQFTYTLSDGRGGSATASVQITVLAVNDAPQAQDDVATTDEDSAVTVFVLDNDSDLENDPLTITTIGTPGNGAAALNPDNTITYTPAADFNGDDSLTYTLTDGQGGEANASVFITVVSVNDAPVAADDSATTDEDVAVTIDVLVNDTDIDNDVLFIQSVTQPGNGTVGINLDGTLTYTPDPDFNSSDSGGAADSFAYTVGDGNGAMATATAFVTVNPVNDAPSAVADETITAEDTAVTIDVVANDSDVDGDTLTITETTPAANGVVTINSDNTLTYLPNLDFNGEDSFAYTLVDGQGAVTVATVTITITPVNDAPVAVEDSVEISEDTVETFAVLTNDLDVDGDALLVSSATTPQHGTVSVNADGTLTYMPEPNYSGPDSFTYTVQDGNGGADTGLVTVTVTPVNDAPVAIDDNVTTNEDVAVTISVLANDIDVDEDALSVSGVTTPALGSVLVNADSTITYVPDTNVSGSDSFTYTVQDDNGEVDTAIVNVTIAPVNDAPVAADDSVTTDEDTAVVVSVLANDSDVDNDALTIVTTIAPANGMLAVNPDNTVTYTPTANYNGADQFSYTIDDGNGATDTAIVSISVTAVNDAPIAVDDAVATPEDQSVAIDVLANDSDVDGDALSVSLDGEPADNGTVQLNADGTITYTPAGSFNGTDSFGYIVSDGQGGSSAAIVMVTVSAENDNPVAVDDSATTEEDVSIVVNVLTNDSDVDGDALTITDVTQPAYGTVTQSGTTVIYIPNANYNGSDSFGYTVGDGNGGSDTAQVLITVTPVNDLPLAEDDSVSTAEDTPIDIFVLANDSDVDGDTLTIAEITQPANGAAGLNADGSLTYTPAAHFNGTDSFEYTVADGNNGNATATVNVLVTPVNDAPVANDDAVVTAEDSPIVIDVLANDTDVDGDSLTVSPGTEPAYGTLVFNGDQSITYTPDANYNGNDSFTYTVADGQGGTAVASVSLTITAVNDSPVAVDDSATVAEDAAITIAVLGNDNDVDGNVLAVITTTLPSAGTVAINDDNTIAYTPAPDFNGTDTFDYTILDGDGGADSATVTVTVTAVNDLPVTVNDTASAQEDTAITIDVLANDSDVDGDTLTVTAVTTATKGTVAINTDNTITYTPNPNAINADSFVYTVTDGQGGISTASVTVAINPVNDAPVAVPDEVSTVEDTAVTVSVLSNDSDVDGDLLTVSDVTTPTHGTVTINADNSVRYVPAPDYYGSDDFAYTVVDGQGGMDTAVVTVTVTPVNDAPVAVDDVIVTPEDVAVTIDVLANDYDVDGDILTVTSVLTTELGTVVLNADNTIIFTPLAEFSGEVLFGYTVIDGNGGSASASITVVVDSQNDNPNAVDDEVITNEDVSIIIDVLGNDVDIDGDSLTISAVTQPDEGEVVNNGADLVFTPPPNFNGTSSFNYTVTDGNGGSDTATVTVIVNSVNDAPVARDDTATTEEGTPVAIAVLSNDSDVDGDTLTVNAVTQPANGIVTLQSDNTIVYTPDAGFSGSDSFSYTVADGNGGSDIAQVAVTVRPLSTVCAVYPIALHAITLDGIAEGNIIDDIFNGDGAGNFGWLTWNGDNSVDALVANLTSPGNSHIYNNPFDPSDHTLSIGDWVEGRPGVSNARLIREALANLLSTTIVVPVWDVVEGNGANTVYQMTGFAEVQLLNYRLPQQDRITVQFVGSATCTDSP